MNPEQSVIDSIDALIDEQLDAGEPLGGYDYGDPEYPECWRCHNQWHGLPLHSCPGSAIEGPAVPRCSHCNLEWHVERVETLYGVCNGSTFIGPRQPNEFERPRDPDGYLPGVPRAIQSPLRVAPFWTLPDNPLDSSGWTDIGLVDSNDGIRHAPERRPLPTVHELIYSAIVMLGDLTYTAQRWLPGDPVPHGVQYGNGARTTFTEIDEHRTAYENLHKITTWANPFLPNDYAAEQRQPRPWLYVPRERVIPCYTTEPNGHYVSWGQHGQRSGNHYRVTGTLPELVDATIETLGTIPRWATDSEQLRWALTHPTIPDGRPYAYGRDFTLGVGTRVGWHNGDGNVWIGTVTEEPQHERGTWTITVGSDNGPKPFQPNDTPTPEQPPMWTVNPAQSRRVNTRRRHR